MAASKKEIKEITRWRCAVAANGAGTAARHLRHQNIAGE